MRCRPALRPGSFQFGVANSQLAAPKQVSPGSPAEFSIDLVAGQKITLLVGVEDPLQARIDLIGPDQQVFASQSNALPDAIYFPPLFIEETGTYHLVATNLKGTSGSINFGFFINTVDEREGFNNATNNTRTTAEDLTGSLVTLPGNARYYSVMSGHFETVSDVDYYRFPLQAGQTVTLKAGFNFGLPAPSPHIRLESPDGQTFPLSTEVTAPEDGVYYLKVANDPARYYNSYSLVILVDSSIEQEPNDSLASAQPLLPGQPMMGFTGVVPDISERASLPYEFANSRYDFGMGFDIDGTLLGADYLSEGSSESVRFFDIGEPHRFILHDGQSDISGEVMGFQTIEPKRVSETRHFDAFTGQAGDIQVERAVMISETQVMRISSQRCPISPALIFPT